MNNKFKKLTDNSIFISNNILFLDRINRISEDEENYILIYDNIEKIYLNKKYWNEEDILTIIKYKEKYEKNLQIDQIILNSLKERILEKIETLVEYRMKKINNEIKNLDKNINEMKNLNKDINEIKEELKKLKTENVNLIKEYKETKKYFRKNIDIFLEELNKKIKDVDMNNLLEILSDIKILVKNLNELIFEE